jgi:hypothetical protein
MWIAGTSSTSALTPNAQRSNLTPLSSTLLHRRRDRAETPGLIGRGFLHFAQASQESSPNIPFRVWLEAWRDLVIGGGHLKEELRKYARARCAEQLRKQRTYELPGHLRGEPVAAASFPWLRTTDTGVRREIWVALGRLADGISRLHEQNILHRNIEAKRVYFNPEIGVTRPSAVTCSAASSRWS